MTRCRRNGRGKADAAGQYVKLEQRLVLLAWLNDLFGSQRNRDLLADMKEAV